VRRFGVRLPERPGRGSVIRQLAVVRYREGRRSLAELAETHASSHEPMRCAMQLMMRMCPALYSCDPIGLPFVLLKMVSLTLKYGATPYSSYGLLGYGMVMSGALGSFKKGFELGELAIRLDERFGTGELESQIYMISGFFLTPWARPFAEALKRLDRAQAASRRIGDEPYGLLAVSLASGVLELCGSIEEIERTVHAAKERGRGQKQAEALLALELRARVYRNFRVPRGNPTALDADGQTEEELQATLNDKDTPNALTTWHCFKAMVCRAFGDYEAAWLHSLELERREERLFSSPQLVLNAVMQVLIACKWIEGRSSAERRQAQRVIKRQLAKLRKWSQACPQNFEAWHLVAAAEAERALGRAEAATAGYQHAIAAAKKSGIVRIEALAEELAAQHFREIGDSEQAEAHFCSAIAAYERWGARGKAEYLRRTQ
jgi:hypothetical protein